MYIWKKILGFLTSLFGYSSRTFLFQGVFKGEKSVLLIGLQSLRSGNIRAYFFEEKEGDEFFRLPDEIKLYNQNKSRILFDGCSDFHFSVVGGQTYCIFKRKTHATSAQVIALLKDYHTWEVIAENFGCEERGVLVNDFMYDKKYVIYRGKDVIAVHASSDLKKWSELSAQVIAPRTGGCVNEYYGHGFYDKHATRIISATKHERGIFVVYDASFQDGTNAVLRIGFAICAPDDPTHVISRGEAPLWEQTFEGKQLESLHMLGAVFLAEEVRLYWSDKESGVMSVNVPDPYAHFRHPLDQTLALHKSMSHNPCVTPKDGNVWETVAAFNPTAFYDGETVHMLYRAMGHDALSHMGYAGSINGLDFHERYDEPAYYPRESFEGVFHAPNKFSDLYMSGGGWGGCEDARVTYFEEEQRVYVFYVAYNGYQPPRVAFSWMSSQDFKNKEWEKWSKPKLVSPSLGIDTKGPCLFPEKVNGKYVICHRVFPDILIDYVDSLDELGDGDRWLEGHERIRINPARWDSRKIGVGGAPIKTNEGWLMVYYGVDDRDSSQYKIGAMLLDLNEPHKVLARSRKPILIPDAHYEAGGIKGGVAYPCGFIVKNDVLYVYYGGADTVSCVATTPLSKFIENLKKQPVEDFSLKEVGINHKEK